MTSGFPLIKAGTLQNETILQASHNGRPVFSFKVRRKQFNFALANSRFTILLPPRFQVTVGTNVAVGSGPNKKLAKRAAAENILQVSV